MFTQTTLSFKEPTSAGATLHKAILPLDLPDKAGIVFDISEYADNGADLKSNSAELVLLLSLGLLLVKSSAANLSLALVLSRD